MAETVDILGIPQSFEGSVKPEEYPRLQRQHDNVKHLMLDGQWRTLYEISLETGYSDASISAQLRHLRKPRFGSYLVEKRRRGRLLAGLWEYRVRKNGN